MYADYFLLLLASLFDLQTMINICCEELEVLDMKLNVSKSQVIRVGRAYRREASCITIDGKSVQFVKMLKYLGWHILSAATFTVSLHELRVRFFQSCNSLFAKCSNFNEPVLQHLVNSKCL